MQNFIGETVYHSWVPIFFVVGGCLSTLFSLMAFIPFYAYWKKTGKTDEVGWLVMFFLAGIGLIILSTTVNTG